MTDQKTELHKSERFQEVAHNHGWDTTINVDIPESKFEMPSYGDITWTLYAARSDDHDGMGEETLKVVWKGNRQDSARYKYGNYVSDLPHKAAVMAILTGTPDFIKYHDVHSLSPQQLLASRKLPWEDGAPAFDILKKTANKRIRWVRSIDGELCEATVAVDFNEPGSLKNFRVFEAKSGNRTLEWSDRYGFHAVALKQISSVG